MNLLFFMTLKQDVVFVYEDWTVRQALEKMEKYRYSTVPVLARDGRYVGTLTEGDLLWGIRRLQKEKNLEVEEMPLSGIPRRRDYEAVPAATTGMEQLLAAATNQNFVPVVDGRNNFIGLVRRNAILQYFYDRGWSEGSKQNRSALFSQENRTVSRA